MKRLYEVTVSIKQFDDDGICFSSEKRGVFKTWAGSPAQAANNIRYRQGLRELEGRGGYNQKYILEAKLVDTH